MSAAHEAGFVGRTKELRQLGAAVDEARAGRLRIALIDGEPGIGKTALLRAFVDHLIGCTTLQVSGDERERHRDLAIADALLDLARSRQPPRRSRARPSGSLAAALDLLHTVGRLPQHQPIVIAVDDLHWVDTGSLRALAVLARRSQHDALVIAGTVRAGDGRRLDTIWGSLFANHETMRTLPLKGFSTTEVLAFAAAEGHTLTPAAADRLRKHTGGNPLHIQGLLRELPETSLLHEGGQLPVPRSYAATVLNRLATLSGPSKRLVVALAVLGDHATVRAASRVAGISAAIGAAEEAATIGLIRVDGDGIDGSISFTHALTRIAIYDDLPGAQRRSLHSTAARILGKPDGLRHRVAASDGADAQLSAHLRSVAAQQIGEGSLHRAAANLELASRVEPNDFLADHSLFRAVELYLVVGDTDSAGSYAARVRDRPESDERTYTLGLLELLSGDLPGVAQELASLAESLASDIQPDLFKRVSAGAAYLWSMTGNDTEAIRWASHALNVRGPAVTADYLARESLAWGYARMGRIDESYAVLGARNSLGAVKASAVMETMLWAARGVIRSWVGHPSAIDDLRVVERRVRSGSPLSAITVVHVLGALAQVEFRADDWSTAAQHVELAVSLGTDLGHFWHLPFAHQVAAHLYAVRGRPDIARQHAEAARSTIGAGPMAEGRAHVALADAHCAWTVEDWQGVQAALQPFLRMSAGAARHPNLALWRCRLAESLIREGRSEAGLDILRPAEGMLGWGGITSAELTRLRALALRRQKGDEAARSAFCEAGDQLSAPATFSEALLALDYGCLLADSGDLAAERQLIYAERVFQRLEATPFLKRCAAALARVGIRTADQTKTDTWLSGLTPREQVVARLVAEGATNREVAAAMFLSVKGVEYHLGNIFTKLGISSRRQLRPLLGRTRENP